MRTTILTLLAALGVAGPAAASVGTPAELASAPFPPSFAAATDAGGAAVAAVQGEGAAKLLTRPSASAAWSAPVALPGAELGRPAGPVVAAAGEGAAAVAWRLDTPRRYSGIAAIVRDPGDVFGAPQLVAAADAGGVRHPALAVDGEGRALLAYNTNTRVVHLSLKGAIAISLRTAHGTFGAPQVVDERPASPPAVAIGPDGRGVVAWLRDRRVRAVSVDVEAGTIGRVAVLTPEGGFRSVLAAAGRGGAATIAYLDRSPGSYRIAALRRRAGAAFGHRAQIVARTPPRDAFVKALALAGDEDGTAVVAWSAERFGSDHKVGVNGVTSGVQEAFAPAGSARFGAAAVVTPPATLLCDTPAVAAAAGRTVVGFACRDRSRWIAQVATVDRDGPGAPQTALSTDPSPNLFFGGTPVSAGLDASGTWTLLAARPDPATGPAKPGTPVVHRVLAVTGR